MDLTLVQKCGYILTQDIRQKYFKTLYLTEPILSGVETLMPSQAMPGQTNLRNKRQKKPSRTKNR